MPAKIIYERFLWLHSRIKSGKYPNARNLCEHFEITHKTWPLLSAGNPLELKGEPWNVHDDKAMALYWQSSKHRYIPRADNTVIANLLDQNRALNASVCEKRQTRNPWERLWVRVEMRV